jgi:hypothetical protein
MVAVRKDYVAPERGLVVWRTQFYKYAAPLALKNRGDMVWKRR